MTFQRSTGYQRMGSIQQRATTKERIWSEIKLTPGRLWALVRNWPFTLILFFIAWWTFMPILWTFMTSLKGIGEEFNYPLRFIPHEPTLRNYNFLFMYLSDLPIYFKNSMITSIGSVLITVVCASLMGYAFARLDFRGRDLIFYTLIVSMFIPRAGGLMAQYELMHRLRLRNSLLGLTLLLSSGLSVSLFIMRQSFLGMPQELEDAALIDGAGRWKLFWAIAMPFAAGGAMVVAILTFVRVWGEYLVTITMIDVQRLYTVGVGITMFSGSGAMVYDDPYISQGGIQAAGYLAAALPAMLLYVFMQKYFVRGLTEGALKF
jgi:multiple sugar transport system permease protein